jgi:hypothetical protein
MGGKIVLGVGFGLALDVLGLFLIFSGSVAAGIAVLAISTVIVLGVILARGSGSGRERRRAGGESEHLGGVYAGGAYAGYGDNGGDGGGDSGGSGGGSGGFDGGGGRGDGGGSGV